MWVLHGVCISHMLLPFLHSSSAHLPFLIVKDASHPEKSLELVLNGADRDRTDDIQLAKLALSQLSYSPVVSSVGLVCLFLFLEWARQDLNLRPHAYQACALTN